MLATAHVVFDRDYFELRYDEWLNHRSRFKKYEIWLAAGLILFGIMMAITFRHHWIVGMLFASAGVYEFVMAATDKRRWVNARMATVCDDKTVDLVFDSDTLTATSVNGIGIMRLAGFMEFVPASSGFFLIPDTGVSIYVPRASIDPSDSYPALIGLLSSAVQHKAKQNGS